MRRLLSFASALSATAAVMSLVLAMALTTHGALYRSQVRPPKNVGCQAALCGAPDPVFKSCGGGECEQSPFCGCVYSGDCELPDGDVAPCCSCFGI